MATKRKRKAARKRSATTSLKLTLRGKNLRLPHGYQVVKRKSRRKKR